MYVGPNKDHYRLYRFWVIKSSDYFKNGLQQNWSEGLTRRFELDEDDPGAFSIYAHWLIYNELPTIDAADSINRMEFSWLSAAYVLGEKLQAASFRNDIMMALIHKQRTDNVFSGCPTVRYVYENTPESSPLRRFVVDTCKHSATTNSTSMITFQESF